MACNLDSVARVWWTDLVYRIIRLTKMWPRRRGLTMATDQELINRTRTQDRWMQIDIADVCGNIASAAVRSAPYREHVHLIRAGDRWKIADMQWLPQ